MNGTQLCLIVANITYKDWRLHIRYRGNHAYFQWEFTGRCCKTGDPAPQKSRKWFLSPYATESEVVLTAFKAALTAEEHECRENFTYEGKRILNPHVSVRALMEICEREDTRT